jgi:hypothetical protein
MRIYKMKLNYTMDGTTLTITAYRGERFADADAEHVKTITLDAGVLADELMAGAAAKSLKAYGLLKLVQDRTSQTKGAVEKLDEMQRYFDEYFANGLWKAPAAERAVSEGGGSRRKITATLAQAVAELQSCSALEAEASLKALDKATFERIVKNERVVAKVAEIEASTKVVDLGDLGADGGDAAPVADTGVKRRSKAA